MPSKKEKKENREKKVKSIEEDVELKEIDNELKNKKKGRSIRVKDHYKHILTRTINDSDIDNIIDKIHNNIIKNNKTIDDVKLKIKDIKDKERVFFGIFNNKTKNKNIIDKLNEKITNIQKNNDELNKIKEGYKSTKTKQKKVSFSVTVKGGKYTGKLIRKNKINRKTRKNRKTIKNRKI